MKTTYSLALVAVLGSAIQLLDPALASALTVLSADGGWGSGGGNALVCFDSPDAAETAMQRGSSITDDLLPRIESIEALDLYEAKLPRGFGRKSPPLVEPRAGEDFLAYTSRIIKRMEQTIPALGENLGERRAGFTEETVIFHNSSLNRVHDEASVWRTDNGKCLLVTVAIQLNSGNLWYLHLDERLFFHPKHSEWSRGVLLLHEIVYALARDLGQKDSRNTRLLISLLLSNAPDLKMEEAIQLAVNFGFLKSKMENWEYMAPFEALLGATAEMNYRAYSRVFQHSLSEEANELRRSVGQSEWDLIGRAETLLAELSIKPKNSSLRSLGEALAYLRKAKLVEGQQLLEKIERLHLGLGEIYGKTLLDLFLEEYSANLDYPYLNEEQRQQLKKAEIALIERLTNIAKAAYTQEELENLQAPPPPGVIRFAGDGEVFTRRDLSPFAIIGKESPFTREWLAHNLGTALILELRFDPRQVMFPAFAP